MSSSPTKVLAERDPNVNSSPEKRQDKAMGKQSQEMAPKSLEYQRQLLETRLREEQNQQTYISPSDNIMSPATAKLAAFKNKHVKSIKPRTLFAKAAANNAEAANKQSTATSRTLGS